VVSTKSARFTTGFNSPPQLNTTRKRPPHQRVRDADPALWRWSSRSGGAFGQIHLPALSPLTDGLAGFKTQVGKVKETQYMFSDHDCTAATTLLRHSGR
jgi:hypothetical protein